MPALLVDGCQNPRKDGAAKKVGMALAFISAAPCSRTLGGKRWLGGKPCQGRQPPQAGAAGPPLQGLPPSHTRPPRSTADPRDAASSAIFARIHAAGNTPLIVIERWQTSPRPQSVSTQHRVGGLCSIMPRIDLPSTELVLENAGLPNRIIPIIEKMSNNLPKGCEGLSGLIEENICCRSIATLSGISRSSFARERLHQRRQLLLWHSMPRVSIGSTRPVVIMDDAIASARFERWRGPLLDVQYYASVCADHNATASAVFVILVLFTLTHSRKLLICSPYLKTAVEKNVKAESRDRIGSCK